MKKLSLLIIVLLTIGSASGQDVKFMPLYSSAPAEGNGLNKADERLTPDNFTGATEADYALFLPDKARTTGQAVVICPGGGYQTLAYNHEGIMVARWMNEQGIAAVVLRYRMPNTHHNIPLDDLHTAIKMVRVKSSEWGIDPKNVGVIGFSAGGHLASTAATHFTEETRPDFAVLIYPVISLDERYTHFGSRYNLIGREYNAGLVAEYSNDLRVTAQTPRTFIAFSSDDRTVTPLNGTLFYHALLANKIPAELHIYPVGGHGWGWRENFKYHDEFTHSLSRWLTGK